MSSNRQKAEQFLDNADSESGEQWDVMMGIGHALLAIVDAMSEPEPKVEYRGVETGSAGEDIQRAG